ALKLGVKFGSEFEPLRVGIQLTAIAVQGAQKKSDTGIDVRFAGDVRCVPKLVGRALVIDLQSRISRDAKIAGGKVRKQRLFARPAIAMALVASRLAAEQLIAQFYLRRELVVSCLNVVVL